MRIKKTDYGEISRQSIRREIERYGKRHTPQPAPEQPKEGNKRRIQFVGEQSSYYRFRSYLIGKVVRLIEQAPFGGWICEFVYEEDRQALNRVADWADKRQYLLDNVKFKE